MTGSSVVSNSSPIIALDRIGRLDLLEMVFGRVEAPPAVVREVTPRSTLPPWIVEIPLAQAIGARILQASLGAGESEAIALALEKDARILLLDDWGARRLAIRLSLPVAGTLAVLIQAKKINALSLLKPELDRLVSAGFRISPSVLRDAMRIAGELPE